MSRTYQLLGMEANNSLRDDLIDDLRDDLRDDLIESKGLIASKVLEAGEGVEKEEVGEESDDILEFLLRISPDQYEDLLCSAFLKIHSCDDQVYYCFRYNSI